MPVPKTTRAARRKKMEASDTMTINHSNSANSQITKSKTGGRPKPIDSWGHFVGFLAILAGLMAWGIYVQHAGVGKSGTAAAGQLGSHSAALRFYFISMIGDWGLFYYCWVGVKQHGGNLATLTGGRWLSWKQVAQDFVIAIPFWLVWEGAADGVSFLLWRGGAQ